MINLREASQNKMFYYTDLSFTTRDVIGYLCRRYSTVWTTKIYWKLFLLPKCHVIHRQVNFHWITLFSTRQSLSACLQIVSWTPLPLPPLTRKTPGTDKINILNPKLVFSICTYYLALINRAAGVHWENLDQGSVRSVCTHDRSQDSLIQAH